jgi:DNA-binding PadR family transcriptional regulator
MTETGFYILLCLQQEMYGYIIVLKERDLTDGEILISPGTLYGSLSNMEKDGLIRFIRKEEKRKIYEITSLGIEVLQKEKERIARLYRTMQEEQE